MAHRLRAHAGGGARGRHATSTSCARCSPTRRYRARALAPCISPDAHMCSCCSPRCWRSSGIVVERARLCAIVADPGRRCCCSGSPSRHSYPAPPAALRTGRGRAACAARGATPVAYEFVSRVAAAAHARVRTRDPAGLRGSRPARGACACRRARPCAMRCRCCRCGSEHSRGRRCPRACSGRWRSPGGARRCRHRSSWWWRRMRCARRCGSRSVRGCAAAARRRCRRRAASAARLRPRRPAHADRLEGDGARRPLDHARVQRGSAPRRAGGDRRRAAVSRVRAGSLDRFGCIRQRRGTPGASWSRTTTTASGSWSMPGDRWRAARRRADLRP